MQNTKNKISQSILTTAILVAIIAIVILFISRKFFRPKLDQMYKSTAEMINY